MNWRNAIKEYLKFCAQWKNLSRKTIKAYSLDLEQFGGLVQSETVAKADIEKYIAYLQSYAKPASLKRKVASVRAFFSFLEKEYAAQNPFANARFKLKEPAKLPRFIPFWEIERLLKSVYAQMPLHKKKSGRYKNLLRDAAVIETLFATGARVSEICGLTSQDVDLTEGLMRVQGKGGKTRLVYIGNYEAVKVLREYAEVFAEKITRTGYFFINHYGNPLQTDSVRLMLRRYTEKAGITLHITPHMFRHSFATLLLDADVDIRYIQQFLGHSSITVTEIYTHVSTSKQKAILREKHPRNRMTVT